MLSAIIILKCLIPSVQSIFKVSDALLKIQDSSIGSKYVVVGTPCQIAGLRKLAEEIGRREQFVFIVFFVMAFHHIYYGGDISDILKKLVR
jgi:coenzyme F420-reducing hydrogenase beta subunit